MQIKPGHINTRRLPILLGLLCLITACDQPQPQSQPPVLPPPEVTVASPLQKEVTDQDEYTGRLNAVKSVDVRSRVGGYLESMHFKEGADVNAGDLLYIIDPRPYQAGLDQARAELVRAKASLDLADSNMTRAERLYKSKTIPEEVFDARSHQKDEAAAAVKAVEAAVRTAELDIEFTHIKAPISGRIGKTLVTEGNLVKGGDMESTLLSTIVSLDPIYVSLTADEQTILRYLRVNHGNSGQGFSGKKRPVRIRLADEQEYTREGYLDFIDNRIDGATGTLEVRGVIPNTDLMLMPGMFVNVQIQGEGPYVTLLIPDSAINVDQTLQYVFIVDENNTAQRREIVTGRKLHGLRMILAGLEDSDQIIIKGIQRVQPGIDVKSQQGVIEEQSPPPVDATAP